MQSTFHTRVLLSANEAALFDHWGELHGRIERKLFATYCANQYSTTAVEALKSVICQRERITSRQFNAIWRILKGKIASKQAVDAIAREALKEDLKAVRATLKRLAKRKAPLTQDERRSWAGKKRRLARLERSAKALDAGRLKLCFGIRKLFRAQFALDENGYADHGEWRAAWQASRTNTFYLLGSKDETGGNQSCTASLEKNGSFTLRLRVPDALNSRNGGAKYVTLTGVHFPYGHAELAAALLAGRALSYRFLRDEKGWRILASTDRVDQRAAFSSLAGVVAVDINADHLAVAERRVLRVEELSEGEARRISHSKMNPRYDALNELLKR